MTSDAQRESTLGPADPGDRPAKIIKRYSNRKLYDTDKSRYVTLEEISRMIRAGEEVRIVDNESDKDLTSVTLTQIIFEEEKRQNRMPLSMLRNLIQSGGATIQDFFDRSVKVPVEQMRDSAQKSVEELRHGAATLRTAATRSVTDFTETARRVFGHREGADMAERSQDIQRSVARSFDDVAMRIETRKQTIEQFLKQRESQRDDTKMPEDLSTFLREELELICSKMKELSDSIEELDRMQKRIEDLE